MLRHRFIASLASLALIAAVALGAHSVIGRAAPAQPLARASEGPPAPTFVQFSPSAVKGALYYPDAAEYPDPSVAVIAMHRNSNYMSHISTKELPARGFVVLGMNPVCDNNEAACAPWEDNALAVKQGIEYLRGLPGIEKVVLLGHSGGGPTMSFYQAVAEQGVDFCQQEQKLMKCGDALAGLPAADGVILMDAHPGNGINAVRSLSANVLNDNAVLNKNQKPRTTWKLDPFDPRNGFKADGTTRYSEEFIERYSEAQSERMDYLIGEAQRRLADAEAEGSDDAPFIVPMGDNARLAAIDAAIDNSTLEPRNLLKNDGTVVSDRRVEGVRRGSGEAGQEKTFDATMFLTAKSFLSVRAVRSDQSMTGIDWCSSNNSTPCNLEQVSAPLLVTAMGAHYFIRDSEQFFDAAASEDKEFYVIEGATHGGTPCVACESEPGQYANATTNLFDLMADWMTERYAD